VPDHTAERGRAELGSDCQSRAGLISASPSRSYTGNGGVAINPAFGARSLHEAGQSPSW
jgi:hypothetical protein